MYPLMTYPLLKSAKITQGRHYSKNHNSPQQEFNVNPFNLALLNIGQMRPTNNNILAYMFKGNKPNLQTIWL